MLIYRYGLLPPVAGADLVTERGAATPLIRSLERLGTALRTAGRAGRKPRVAPEQMERVEAALQQGARAWLPHQPLDLPRVARLIKQLTGVQYHPGHVWRLLGRLEWTLQRPAKRARERNEATIRYWMTTRWPKVKKTLGAGAPGSSSRTRVASRSGRPSAARGPRAAKPPFLIHAFNWKALSVAIANLVILLDEPGLSLHGRAQHDLLRYINEKLKPDHQVLYTTHSPFMVDPDNLLCARTVEDVVEDDGKKILGTKVGDDIWSTDRDTVFALQGALGYDISQSLFVGKHNLLVEGPSDVLYLQ